MKVWFDVTNTPHVLLFKPFIEESLKEGNNIVITARDLSQTCLLLEKYGYQYKKIGDHGKNIISKVIKMIKRTLDLVFFALKEKPDVLLTKSLSGVIAAKICGIKSVFFTDNEHAKTNLARYIADICVCPEVLPFKGKNVLKYKGIEEALYLYNFKPNPKVKKHLKKNKINILIRPTPTKAHYVKNKNDPVYEFIKLVIKNKKIHPIFIPRYGQEHIPGVYVPELPIDAPSLEYFVDVVVSGGGTMTREAAFLGTTAISMFNGPMLAVDKYLIDLGVLYHTTNPKKALNFIKKNKLSRHKVNRIQYTTPKQIYKRLKKIIRICN